MKKKWFIILSAVLLAVSVVACSGAGNGSAGGKKDETDAGSENQESSYIKFPEFESTTILGENIDSAIFAEAKITMVNIWGTFCGPCINEMPDLSILHGELPEGCALIGVLIDVYTDENLEIVNLDAANQIVEESGVNYDNIIPDETLYQFLAENITGVPTTLYVDSEGNILGGVVGVRSKDEYKAILEELLKE